MHKTAAKGYLFILGTAGCGKTSWALDWVRHSQRQIGPPALGARSRLAGWYFARRYSTNGEAAASVHLDEYLCLQSWLAMARQHLCLLPDADPAGASAELFNAEQRSRYADRRSEGWFDLQALLRQRFVQGLQALAASATAQDPLVLLLDGADELWAPGPQTRQVRRAFPELLHPTQPTCRNTSISSS